MKVETITCPYCFEKFQHDEVHFRAEKATTGECPYIPEDYDDYEEFVLNYQGADKSMILEQCEEWEFFKEGMDSEYEAYWKRYGGTTTEQISQQKASYRRKVINPSDVKHQKYLKKQDANGSFLRYVDRFAISITLTTGELCTQRVCPKCHNPLPNQYGKNESRFIAVIGVTGAGKTVYLSQLVQGFEDYVVKAGLAALQTTDSPLVFLRNNPVNTKVALPGSTPPGNFLQPLFYDLSKIDKTGQKKIYTLVVYDVAGENCDMERQQSWFGPFIEHMHGAFLLIDPMQFKVIKGLAYNENAVEKGSPMAVLHAIHNFITQGRGGKCDIPLAICISKSDMETVQDVLEEELADALMDDVEEVTDQAGNLLVQFNAKKYNPIAVKLHDFIKENERALENFISVNYSCYNYFAFTSLGCGVNNNIPEGPIMPKRIEEPLLWLFHKFGFVDANAPVIDYGAPCPSCGNTLYRKRLSGEERILVTKRTLLGRTKEWEEYDFYCEKCQKYYNDR